ncbi:M16 family metallopeptidase [Mucilaginibacter phyllosphaerae]|uniref:Insulinase family protein n=1 Tax=Mucilaginibacter phyllosphaerae TaxID=1812349 RepID=A0A4Y8A8I8_9SPHI|nr:pitrilysin family protein [Mucilaginibacter phyllosphaerae]MBB3970712.1 putative Zn-dependent peptidase [Mucilaginibacter phyllosphaerae]TEW64712.1 insulinase family protein [Mucilaginibacter phyllosphaerae]GGH20440.1 peptidase M16 [Mucilaginibacter phyllosphaerae]
MKKYIYVLLLAAATTGVKPAFAQQKAYEMMVDGVKVIVQPSGNDIVEIQTVIKGGVQNYPVTKTGIESMAMSALTECGTLKHDKNAFKNQLDKISAAVYGYNNKNFAVVKLNCIKSDLDVAWPLYVEAITIPKFDAKEFERIKQDAITELKSQDSDPDNAIDKYADKIAFAGRDYAKDPSGTQETLQKLTAEETKNYYHSVLTKSRMLVVVVGDIDRAAIEAKVKGMLAGIKQGAPFELKKSFFRVYKNTFSGESRELATNYVEGITSGPAPGTPDFDAFNVAMRIFYDKHFLDVRTNNGLSYAPSAWFSPGATSVAKFSVSTTEPDKYIKVFDKLVDKIKTQGFNAAEVADMKVTYLTGFYYKNETNTAQASSIVSNEVLHNNWKRSLTLADDVKKLTPAQVSDAFRKYIGNIIWVYQGDTKKVNPILFTNGTINKGDNPVTH